MEVPYFLSKYDPDPLRIPCGLFMHQVAASDLRDRAAIWCLGEQPGDKDSA